MTTPAPAGFAPIFAGWNVWDVWQADDPTFSVMNIGLDLERELRIWVENEIKDNAPGAAVADPANPAALRGDQVQPIPHVDGLTVVASRADIPGLAGALTIGSQGSKATLRTVRFFNRAGDTVLPWAHDENYVLDAVYQPSTTNPVTNAAAPSSLAGAASSASSTIEHVVTIGAVVLGGAILLLVLSKMGRSS